MKFFGSERVIVSIVLLIVLNILFFPVIWGDKTLIHSASDASSIMPYGAYHKNVAQIQLPRSPDMGAPAWFAEPYYALLNDYYFRRLIPPLWNPFNGLGVPLLANMQSQPFNPLGLIAWLWPSPRGDDLFVITRLFLAGFLAHLYLKRFLSTYASLFGALAFMLTGYFIIYLNMPDISVSIWLPGLCYGLERLALRPSRLSVLIVAFMTAMVLLGGMPESSFLVLVFGGFYFLSRLPVLYWKMEQIWRGLVLYGFASVCGIGIAAPQVVPFLEYMRESFNAHQLSNAAATGPGMLADGNFILNFGSYLVPMLFGPLGALRLKTGVDFAGVHGYWGVIPFFFAILAVAVSVRSLLIRSTDRRNFAMPIVWFFSAALFFMVAKRFGFVLVNWIGTLPLAQLVLFRKYDEPLIGFAIAVLAAVGFDYVENRKANKVVLSVAFVIVLLVLGSVYLFDHSSIENRHASALFNRLLLISSLLLLAAFALSICASTAQIARSLRVILLLLTAELSLSFMLPTFFWFHKLAPRAANPYEGAPYIDFLSSKLVNFQRISGLDGVLYPNWSSAFGICDLRDLDAMYPKRYFPFVRNFLNAPDSPGMGDKNVTTRFSGADEIADPLFSTASPKILKRLWALSSVRYLLASREHFLPSPPPLIKAILAGHPTANPDYLRLTVFNIAGQNKYVLFQHPYGPDKPNTVQVTTKIPMNSPWLHLSIGMDPSVFGITHGDGVDFKLVVVDKNKPHEVFSRYIDPKSRAADRQWHSGSVDLSSYKGRTVALQFVVDSGPNGNAASDWAGWADVQFVSNEHDAPAMGQSVDRPPVVYDKEVKIYDLRDSLPRAALFYAAQYVNSPEQALESLRSESFDIRSRVILESSESPVQISNTPVKVVEQTINRYEPLLVDISVKAERPGILMLNDEFYPGWNAYVDDQRVSICHADYLFRGVPVQAGAHRVIFRYEPTSFFMGILWCIGSIFALTLYLLSLHIFKVSFNIAKASKRKANEFRTVSETSNTRAARSSS